MSMRSKYESKILPAVQEYITDDDRKVLDGVFAGMDEEITTQLNTFRETLKKQLDDFEARDFAGELAAEIKANEEATLKHLEAIEKQAAALRKLEAELREPVALTRTKEAADKLGSAADALETELKEARTKVQNLGSAGGRLVGGALRKLAGAIF